MSRRLSTPQNMSCILIMVFALFINCNKKGVDPSDSELLSQLQTLPDVEAVALGKVNGHGTVYILEITQPVDHGNPNGPQFSQRAYLNHVDETAPMVFAPSGYATLPTDMQEITIELNANQLVVSHRYFYDSRPEPLDWQYLTTAQAAADHHRIVTLFKQIYQGPWISSGWSKGGHAVLCHRRFYPEDVQATIAYSAPIFKGLNDERCAEYLRDIGNGDDWQRIDAFQRTVLINRSDIVPMVESWFPLRNLEMSLDPELVLEMAVAEYPRYFWGYKDVHQYSSEQIPDPSYTPFDLYSHLTDVVWFHFYCDSMMTYFEPYQVQACTEMGSGALDIENIEDLLQYMNEDLDGLGLPTGFEPVFNPDVMEDIHYWLENSGTRIIALYGALDALAGTALHFQQSDNLIIIQDDAGHGVRIQDLDDPDAIYSRVRMWLNL